MNKHKNAKDLMPASDLFRMHYPNGQRNFITPTPISYAYVTGQPNIAYEISTGRSMAPGEMLYGITFVQYNPENGTTTNMEEESTCSRDMDDLMKIVDRLSEKTTS